MKKSKYISPVIRAFNQIDLVLNTSGATIASLNVAGIADMVLIAQLVEPIIEAYDKYLRTMEQ